MTTILKLHINLQDRHLAVAGLALVLSVWACVHVILFKRDTRAAIGWVGFICWVPLIGSVIYFIFGVNRLRREAILLRGGMDRFRAGTPQGECAPEELHHHLPTHAAHLNMLARVVGDVVQRPLLPGNEIDPLLNGDEAYPAMIAAIEQARQTVSLQTYIFDRDEAGLAFVHALGDAVRRGVQARVLVDATGLSATPGRALPTHCGTKGCRSPVFFPRWPPGGSRRSTCALIARSWSRMGALVLRRHEHRVGHCLRLTPRSPVQDIHFRLRGPVVTQLQEAFC